MKRARKAETISRLVSSLLADCGIRNVPVPVERVASHLGAEIRYSPFDGELAGMLVRDGGSAVIGVNSAHHVNRQRFTIAHECGHLCLHKGKDVYIDRSFRVNVNRRDPRSARAIDPEEIEANRFAAELLMPRDVLLSAIVTLDIEDDHQLRQLADRFQVSVQALTHRINNLLQSVI